MEEEKEKGKKRSKEEREGEGLIKGRGDLGDQSKERGELDQRGHWKEEEVFGRREVFF